ncbi:xylose isomerase [Planctomycetales bacterium ZRK34]|nr:xylose isomerase [Planctomycetales bacterium ZRK34]
MAEYFPRVKAIKYEGPDSKNPLAFKHYDPKRKVGGKTMAEHLRFAVCYWHSFRGAGADPFGVGTRTMPWLDAADEMTAAEQTLDACFEFISKLGVGFWCFHDRDIAPEGADVDDSARNLEHIVKLAKKKQRDTGIKLLWGTANLFSHPRYRSGAATACNPHVVAHAASQVKRALDATKYLGGSGYVFWGGREGYESLLHTDMARELDHLGRFLHMALDYKKKIRFGGQFFIEPKPKEPTKHQYDSDAAACHAFLQKYDLVKDFKLNIEANHATLAGHEFMHDLMYAADNKILGSVDANRGDTLLGWDTDQFPTNIYETALAMMVILKAGGFTKGGLNFDAKLRRQSVDVEDLFYAHIGAMDAFARGLVIAHQIIKDKALDKFVNDRYKTWNSDLGRKFEKGKLTLDQLEAYARKHGEPAVPSGRQELIENVFNDYIK